MGKEETTKKSFVASKWYNADDVAKPLNVRKKHPQSAKLRANVTPGTVLILLAGRFRGKRVIFLKQLESGLLLVTGPYKVNGVNLRRVNQAYVLSTSTKLDVSKVDTSSINDTTFARVAVEAPKEGSEDFFKTDKKKSECSAERKALQIKVDKAVSAAVASVPNMKVYLNAKFTLTRNDKPHNMKF